MLYAKSTATIQDAAQQSKVGYMNQSRTHQWSLDTLKLANKIGGGKLRRQSIMNGTIIHHPITQPLKKDGRRSKMGEYFAHAGSTGEQT